MISDRYRNGSNHFCLDEFIADAGLEGDDEDVNRRAAVNARLDRRERELNDQDLAKIAQNLHERYRSAAVRYTGDMNEVPQRLLMPSVHDASLWQVRVKVVYQYSSTSAISHCPFSLDESETLCSVSCARRSISSIRLNPFRYCLLSNEILCRG